jgi:hypothetical protein
MLESARTGDGGRGGGAGEAGLGRSLSNEVFRLLEPLRWRVAGVASGARVLWGSCFADTGETGLNEESGPVDLDRTGSYSAGQRHVPALETSKRTNSIPIKK